MIVLSFYINKKINYKCYKINIKELIKNDKSALFLSLATKIGVGSVIGTVSSIIIGGYQSIIWLILFSIITIPLIYSESKLGNIYKQSINNKNIGGPYYIIKYGIKNKILSYISLILIIILYSFLFQMIQINTISNLLKNTLFIDIKYILIFIILFLLIITKLNINDITKIINIIVPIKCILFIIICSYGIISHFGILIESIKQNVNNLFNIKAIISSIIIGIKRCVFMNEIMIGTTSISSGSDIDIELSTRYQILSVYFISIIITILITLLMLIYTHSNTIINDYNLLIIKIFRYINGNIGPYLITIILVLFSFTTLLSGYYILECHIKYTINNKHIIYLIKTIFIILLSLSSIIDNSFLWKYTDTLIFIMIIINSYSIIKLMGDVIHDR